MPAPPFSPRPVPTVRYDSPAGGAHSNPRSQTSAGGRSHLVYTEVARPPQGILRPPLHTQTSYDTTMYHHPQQQQQQLRPQHPHSFRTGPSSPYHHHTSSSPELRPRVDSAWSPRSRQYNDLGQMTGSGSSTSGAGTPPYPPHMPRPRGGAGDQDPYAQRRSAFAARVNPQFVPARGRSASDVRVAHTTPPPDLERDRMARACGQSAAANPYQNDDRARRESEYRAGMNEALSSGSGSRLRGDSGMSGRATATATATTSRVDPPKPSIPKMKLSHMYRRLDALARRVGRRAMDYLGLEDVVELHKRDIHLREQLKRKRSERMQEKDPNFHAIGAPLEDVLLYASTSIVMGDYQYDLPIAVVACVEELTRTGIYQSGLFRALPSRDRHLQLIDLFDKSADYGSQFNMRGQTMPDICALLSTFLSSLPGPLLDPHIYSGLWHWSVKPSMKREDERREQEEEEEEERRARGEPPRQNPQTDRDDLRLETDLKLEVDQISIAQILLRFLPIDRLSLLIYLFAFFTQLPLCPENGLEFEDVARIFGFRLLGGAAKQVSQKMMVWLLTRWQRILEGLFSENCGFSPPTSPSTQTLAVVPPPVPVAATSSGSSSNADKVDGKPCERVKEKRASTSSSSRSGESRRSSSSDGVEEEDSSGDSKRRKKRDLGVVGSGGSSSRSSQDRRRSSGAHSTRKDSRQGHGHRSSRRHHGRSSSDLKESPIESQDGFSLAFTNNHTGSPNANTNASPTNANTNTSPNTGTNTNTDHLASTNAQLLEARVRISRLESELRKNDARVVGVMKEKMVAEDEAMQLAGRVEALERMLRERADGDAGVDVDVNAGAGAGEEAGAEEDLKAQLRLVEAERDEVQRIMKEMRKLLDDRVAVACQ